MASLSGVETGTSLKVLKEFLIGLWFTKLQRYLSKDPNSF